MKHMIKVDYIEFSFKRERETKRDKKHLTKSMTEKCDRKDLFLC